MCSKVVKISLIVKFRCAIKTSFTRRPTPPPRPVSLGWCKNLYPVGQNSPMVLLLLTSDFSQVSVIAIKSTLLSTAKSLSSKALLTIDRELNRRKSLCCRQLHVLLLAMVAAAAAVAVSSICIDAVRMRLLWLSIICFVLFMQL